MPWYVKLFVDLGGVALVWKLVGSNARASVHGALGFTFHKLPGFAEFVRANADRIKPILEGMEQGAEDAVNDIPAPVAPAPEPPKAS